MRDMILFPGGNRYGRGFGSSFIVAGSIDAARCSISIEFGVRRKAAPAISLPPKFYPFSSLSSGSFSKRRCRRENEEATNPTSPNSPLLELVIKSVDNDKINNYYYLSVVIPEIQCAISHPNSYFIQRH